MDQYLQVPSMTLIPEARCNYKMTILTSKNVLGSDEINIQAEP
jgi:hypothetical protein